MCAVGSWRNDATSVAVRTPERVFAEVGMGASLTGDSYVFVGDMIGVTLFNSGFQNEGKPVRVTRKLPPAS